jgi:hypothetical protein
MREARYVSLIARTTLHSDSEQTVLRKILWKDLSTNRIHRERVKVEFLAKQRTRIE